MSTRALLSTDWNPVLRDPIDVLRAVFVVAALVHVTVDHASVVNLAVSSAAVIAVYGWESQLRRPAAQR